MDKPAAPMPATTYWYNEPGAINVWFYGVFEGGGAKGVAYSGALLALQERKCWFSAVAGASAGAITAALIAAGLSPQEMEAATDSALRQVRTGVWAGLRRLRNETGYFPSDNLRNWLDELFRAQVRKSGAAPSATGVTFSELHEATGIELNVIAADLSLHRQVIFSHLDTPKCAVADAVAASCSIPFAFPSRLLQVAQDGEAYHHTIVDGGVWSNFPIFIFEDPAFRHFYERVPAEVDPGRVLGFLLRDLGAQIRLGHDITFVEGVPGEQMRAREWATTSVPALREKQTLGMRVASALLFPFSLLGRIAEWNGGMERGRWPDPPPGLARHLVQGINGLLGGIYPALFGVLACAVVGVGAWQVIHYLGVDQFNAFRAMDWSELSDYLGRAFSLILGLMGIAIAVLVFFAAVLGVIVNFTLLRTLRRILYGLVTTYVAGPGAAEWFVKKPNIISLPIPPTVSTLTFDMDDESRRQMIAGARATTLARLDGILSGATAQKKSAGNP